MDTRTWAGITLGVAFAAVLLNSCEAKAYEKSVCNRPPQEFAQEWYEEAGESPFFEYRDRLSDDLTVIKVIFINPDTGTWTLVTKGPEGICTMRSGKGIYIHLPPNMGEAA